MHTERIPHLATVLTAHLLSLLLLTPLAGVVVIAAATRVRPAVAGPIALITSLLGLGLAVLAWLRYDPAGSPFQIIERVGLTRSGVGYLVGADGLTVTALVVIEAVGLLAILTSWSDASDGRPDRQASLLIFQAAMVGIVIALDALLFAACWAVLLTSVAAAIEARRPTRWGGVTLVAASVLALLTGILLIHAAARDATGVLSFDVANLQQISLPGERQTGPFLLLFAAFASAAAALTLGAAFPRTRSHAALVTAAVVLLPSYAWVRFNSAMLPQASRAFVPLIAATAIASLLMAAVLAWRSREGSRTLTWAAVAQLGVILLGVAVIDPQALGGSLVNTAGFALAVAPLSVLLSFSSGRTPAMVAGGWIVTLAAIGVPGLIAFTGGAAVVTGASHAHPMWAFAAGVGLLAIAAALVRAAQLTLARPGTPDRGATGAIAAITLAFAGLAIVIGVAPQAMRARLEPTMARVITRLDAGYAPVFAKVPGCGGGSVPAPSAPAGFTAIAPCDSAASTPK